MKRITWIGTALVMVVVVLAVIWSVWPTVGAATETYMGYARTKYPSIVGSRLDNCKLCHASEQGGPPGMALLNSYGWDWWLAGANGGNYMAAFSAIECPSCDSDGDGHTNLAEITALTFPGDEMDFPVITPTPTGTATPTRTSTPTQTSTPTVTSTPTNTPLITNTPTRTLTPTVIGTPTNTPTPTPTRTSSPTATPINSPTVTTTPPAYVGRAHGTVRLTGRSNWSGSLVNIGGRYVVTANDGSFAIDNIPTGVWSAAASHTGYLWAWRSSVVILGGQNVLLPEVILRSGDVDGDCLVTLFDLVAVSAAYDPSGAASNPRADLNGDGLVNLFDLTMVSSDYGFGCPQIW